MKLYSYVVENKEEGRLDKWIADAIPDLSRSYIQKLIKQELVLVNGKPEKASYMIQDQDEISLQVPDAQLPDIEPENIPLDILFEDEDLLVVNKTKGMVVHPAPGHYSGTLVNAVLYHCKDNLSGINGVLRPGIVHRIDRDTTGSIMICKNDKAHQHIALQLKEHSIHRVYHCIVIGNIKEDEGTIEGAIGRDPSNRLRNTIDPRNGKPAITHYKVLQRFPGYTYVACKLETGRTHQIRVHMKSIGHPLLGDSLYGGNSGKWHLEGQTLHAKTLGFIHPSTEKYVELDAPLPAYFEKILKSM